jgi:trehalose 6-phosphate phosphatase
MPSSLPAPLPNDLLATLARRTGLLLCLDYDGTLAELTADPAMAAPYPGVREQLRRLTSLRNDLSIAIVTGRALSEVKRLLGIESGLFFSGVHGLELDTLDAKPCFAPEALACASEVSAVRRWLASNVPEERGFKIEDKQIAIGLHFRAADAQEAAALCDRFARFIAGETPSLKLLRLKMLAEAMPIAASKARAVVALKKRVPASYVTAYFGDDTTDEDAFAALGQEDVGVLVAAERDSLARYRVEDPAAVLHELRSLASLELR